MNPEEQLKQVLAKLDDLAKEHHKFVVDTNDKYQETRRERRERRWGPWAMVLVVWIVGVLFLRFALPTWGAVQGDVWATVVLRAAVLIAAFVCMTTVSVAALRRDW